VDGNEKKERESPQALPPPVMVKSCVQPVSNNLLNLIKRACIILQSPGASWTSAIMNIFCSHNNVGTSIVWQSKTCALWKSSQTVTPV